MVAKNGDFKLAMDNRVRKFESCRGRHLKTSTATLGCSEFLGLA